MSQEVIEQALYYDRYLSVDELWHRIQYLRPQLNSTRNCINHCLLKMTKYGEVEKRVEERWRITKDGWGSWKPTCVYRRL